MHGQGVSKGSKMILPLRSSRPAVDIKGFSANAPLDQGKENPQGGARA